MTDPLPARTFLDQVEEFSLRHRTGLLTLIFTDIVGSTELKRELGDHAAAAVFKKHDALIRQTLAVFPEGREIETAGDSFLLVFATPSSAVRFALLLQARLKPLRTGMERPLEVRTGIHTGEVLMRAEESRVKGHGLFGIQIDTCARLMSLAKGGQILMTRAVFDSARPVLKGEDIEGAGPLSWLNHGPYLFKGMDEPVEVCEVGELGQHPINPPSSSEKAQRQVRAGEEEVLGWRPAVGQGVPNTKWVLEEKLGEGGFGEVWLGRHQLMKERRVFKFCFHSERVRFLKREMTLFRLLKERVGGHPNIVSLREVCFDEPPYYVEMEYVEGKDLRSWCEARGGPKAIPIESRLEIVAQAAEALQAAHDAGIIHRDIKPANVLIESREPNILRSDPSTFDRRPAPLTVKLTDFGIGQVVSQEALAGMTKLGFTQTMLSPGSSSQTGTHLYMAPELFAGQPASTRSDIYSLGVVLFQLWAGDFSRPVTTDWVNEVEDPLLREDLQKCFAGHPTGRFAGAGQLAQQLRSLPERRAELAQRQAELIAREKRAYRRGVMRAASLAALVVTVVLLLAWSAVQQSGRAAQAEQEARRNLYFANLNLAQADWEDNNIGRFVQLLEEVGSSPERGFEWYYWQRLAHMERRTLPIPGGLAHAEFSWDGHRILAVMGDRTITVRDLATGRTELTLDKVNASGRAMLSPDGRQIAVVLAQGTVAVRNLPEGQPVFSLASLESFLPRGLAFSTDGTQLAVSTAHHRVTLFNTSDGSPVRILEGHHREVISIAFSPDGQIATGSQDGILKIWDAWGREQRSIQAHPWGIVSIRFSPDGRHLATGADDNLAKIWNLATGEELFRLEGHSEWVFALCFSPDGKRLATSGDHVVRIWDVASGTELAVLKSHLRPVIAVSYTPDGSQLFSASMDGAVKAWDAALPKEVVMIDQCFGSRSSLAFLPDGKRLLTCLARTNLVKLWDSATGQEMRDLGTHASDVESLAVSPDGNWIVTHTAGGIVSLWNTTTGSAVSSFQLESSPRRVWGQIPTIAIDGLATRLVHPDGDTAAVYDLKGGRESLRLKEHTSPVLGVAFTKDGQRIGTASADGTAKVWDAETGRSLLTIKAQQGSVTSVAFSPDGRRLATSGQNGTTKVWDTASGRLLLTLRGHRTWVATVLFSPDGRRILTGGDDATARLWDAISGRETLTLRHTDTVQGIAFSPDGRRLAASNASGTVRIWEAATEEQVASWRGQTTEPRAP